MKNNYIDLHVHTNYSDGLFYPKDIINLAKENNVQILSITDHDSISSLEEFKNNICDKMIGIKGVEFSSYINIFNKKIKLHILGYCFDENNINLKKLINEMLEKRREAHINLLKEINNKIKNFPEENLSKINFDRYCWFDREIINYLEDNNVSKEKIEYLRNFYKFNKFSYGFDYDLPARKVIDAIHSAGGYVIFAHPMAYKIEKEQMELIINHLISMGIDGIETYQSDCSDKDSMWLNKIVETNNLLNSVGSDFHRIIRSDGRKIGLGINNNLCIEETLLTNKILQKKQYFERNK